MEEIHELLNKAEALLTGQLATTAEMAAVLLPDKPAKNAYVRTHEWIKQRKHPISTPEVLIALQRFVASKVEFIEKSKALKRLFGNALKEVTKRRKQSA